MWDRRTPHLCQFLRDETLTTWGLPKYIVSDWGPQFTSQILMAQCKKWGIIQKKTTSYHLQSNLIECVNWNPKTMIASFVGQHHKDWDKWLLEFSLNNAQHEAMGWLTGDFWNALWRDLSIKLQLSILKNRSIPIWKGNITWHRRWDRERWDTIHSKSIYPLDIMCWTFPTSSSYFVAPWCADTR